MEEKDAALGPIRAEGHRPLPRADVFFGVVRRGGPDWYLHFVEDLIKAVCFKWQISSGGIDVSTVFGK